MLSIISGTYRGMQLLQPKSSTTRPVSQKVRGAIFNTLGQVIQDAQVLDLYAGSGALGLEALSRGAKHTTLVDKSSEAHYIQKTNTANLQLQNKVTCIKTNVETFLSKELGQFDVIFFDPPYALFDVSLVNQVANLVQSTGVIVLSCAKNTSLDGVDDKLEVIQQKYYGDTQIAFLQVRS